MLLLKKAFYLFSWIRYSKITMLKGQGKISRREAEINVQFYRQACQVFISSIFRSTPKTVGLPSSYREK